VRLELLAAAMKLFFKRAPEMRGMLGKALAAGTADANQDVHDRAMMYARLLQHDPEAAARVVGCSKETIANFSESAAFGDKYAEQIFKEFNTLSVMYKKPAFMFTEDVPTMIPRTPSLPDAVGGYAAGGAGVDLGASIMMNAGDSLIDLDGGGGGGGGVSSGVDLLGGDLLGGGGGDLLGTTSGGGGGGEAGGTSSGGATPAEGSSANNLLDLLDVPLAAGAPAPPPPPPAQLALNPAPVLDAGTFQQRWGVLPLSPACAAGGARTLSLGRNTVGLYKSNADDP
jgi:hypothetical protein